MVEELEHLDRQVAPEAAAVAIRGRAEAVVRRLGVQRYGQIDEALYGLRQKEAVGRHAMHAPRARRALQEVGDRLRLHVDLRAELVHARRLRAVALEQRREALPQRLVLRGQHRTVARQAQARAFAHQPPRLSQMIDQRYKRRADLGGTRPDRVRMRRVPVGHRALERVALRLPSFAPHGVAHAAHVERHQSRRIARRQVERLGVPLHVDHAIGEQRFKGFLGAQPGDALAARRPARGRQRVDDHARAHQSLRARVAQQEPVTGPRRHLLRKRQPREAPGGREPRVAHRRAEMDADHGWARERLAEPGHLDVEVPGDWRGRSIGDHVAAPDIVARDTVQRERAALAGDGARGFAVVRAQAAHARLAARGQHLYLVAQRDRAGGHRAGGD
ncbi:MAG TPA: hypothetical protein VKP89_10135 [Burkholderiales bacterium]|nr:hypothetical protein [Burkholderiales bacterium]